MHRVFMVLIYIGETRCVRASVCSRVHVEVGVRGWHGVGSKKKKRKRKREQEEEEGVKGEQTCGGKKRRGGKIANEGVGSR